MHFFGISVWFAFSALLCANLAFQSSQEYYDYEQEEGDDGMSRLLGGQRVKAICKELQALRFVQLQLKTRA
ncbi:vascular endothelial growth factor C isoform X1 [Tachysurus ichikawai]